MYTPLHLSHFGRKETIFGLQTYSDHLLKNYQQQSPWLSYRVKIFQKVTNRKRRKITKFQPAKVSGF